MKTLSTYLRTVSASAMLLALAIPGQAQKGRKFQQARYYPAVQRYYTSIPGPYTSINYGGNPYYYSAGIFYRTHNGYFNVVPPPYGIRVNTLPPVYYPVTNGNTPYYYANGVFYRSSSRDQDYEVVQAPIGAAVPSIPGEAKTMLIDGEKYYSLNGTYFKDELRPNGELWYKVVGKNGVLNTYHNNTAGTYQQQQDRQQIEVAPQQQQPAQQQAVPQPQMPTVQQQVYVFPQQGQVFPQQGYPQTQVIPQQQQVYPQRQSVPQQQQVIPQQQNIPQQEYPVQQIPEPKQERVQPKAIMQSPTNTRESQSNENQGWPANGGVREAIRRGSPAVADSTRKQEIVTEDDDQDLANDEYTAPPVFTHDNPGLGWVVDKLPQDCKTVTISGKKYFIAPNNTYYEEIVDAKRQVRYKVVAVNR